MSSYDHASRVLLCAFSLILLHLVLCPPFQSLFRLSELLQSPEYADDSRLLTRSTAVTHFSAAGASTRRSWRLLGVILTPVPCTHLDGSSLVGLLLLRYLEPQQLSESNPVLNGPDNFTSGRPLSIILYRCGRVPDDRVPVSPESECHCAQKLLVPAARLRASSNGYVCTDDIDQYTCADACKPQRTKYFFRSEEFTHCQHGFHVYPHTR